jgi:hypothetical protein
MKRKTVLFSIAILTFLAGVVAAASWAILRRPSVEYLEDPDCFRSESSIVRCVSPKDPISFCEVVQNPDRYNDKIIRIRAVISGYHHQHLFDSACDAPSTQTLVDYADNDAPRKLMSAIADLDDPEIKDGLIRANVIVIGRFEAYNSKKIRELMPSWFEDEEIRKQYHPLEDKFLFTIEGSEQVRKYEP